MVFVFVGTDVDLSPVDLIESDEANKAKTDLVKPPSGKVSHLLKDNLSDGT